MEIKLHEIKVRDIINGYEDNQESGVLGYGGKLDIRPPFQREFIYNEKERNAVIKAALVTYLPMYLAVVACFAVAVILLYLWLK